MRTVRNSILLCLFLPLTVLAIAIFARGDAQAQGNNLLRNPSFEEGFYTFDPDDYAWVALYGSQRADCRTSDGQNLPCNTAQTPTGWIPWWISHADGDPDWKNRMPEYKPATQPFANRIRSGNSASQYFTFHSTHTAGLLQVVTVPANAEVQFSIWGQAWSSVSDSSFSDFPTTVNMRIGIDPTGSTNPYNPAIVWSDYKQPYDTYQQFTVSAQAQGDTVTVFTISSPDEARKHNDIYWDDASLVVTGQGAAPLPTATTVAATAAATASSGTGDTGGTTNTGNTGDASSSPAATAVAQGPGVGPSATPDAEGVIYYEVQAGDSFWSIAARHGLTIDQIYELNNAGEGDFVQPGELLVVGHAAPPATPAPEVDEEAAAEPTATSSTPPTPTATPQPETGDVCLVAYSDANQNGQRDGGEPLKSSVAFSIYDGEQVLVNYVTDGSNEPYCIALNSGNYRITRSTQPNETLTTDGEWAIAVTPGSEQDFEFGSFTGDAVALAPTETDGGESGAMAIPEEEETSATPEEAAQSESGVTRWVVIAAVVVAVLLFVGVLIIILSGRRSTI